MSAMLPNDTNKLLMILAILNKELNDRSRQFYYSYKASQREALRFHHSQKRIRVVEGGVRSGKTTAVIHEIAEILMGEHPHWSMTMKGALFAWLIVPSIKKYNEMWKRKLKAELPANRWEEFGNGRDKAYEWRDSVTGSRILIKTSGQNIKEFGGDTIDIGYVDERLDDEEKRLQLRTRIAERNGLLFYTFDKIEEDSWVGEMCQLESTERFLFDMRYNRFLSAQAVAELESELKAIDRDRLMLGIHRTKGVTYLFPEALFCKKSLFDFMPAGKYDFVGDRFVASENGVLSVCEPPVPGRRYILSIDSSEGLGENDAVSWVMDEFGHECAVMESNKIGPREWAVMSVVLGVWYNNALVVPEVKNLSGGILIENLLNLCRNIYVETTLVYQGNKTRTEFGIKTDPKIKHDMYQLARDCCLDDKVHFHFQETVDQMKTFVRYDIGPQTGKMKGLKKDDRVLAVLLALRAASKYNLLRSDEKRYIREVAIKMTREDFIKRQLERRANGVNDIYHQL